MAVIVKFCIWISFIALNNQVNGAMLPNSSGLELPRFVSIKATKANMHNGAGKRYPILWVYVRQNLPVKVIAEFDVWRKVEDHEGNVGWFHQSLLSGRRTAMIMYNTRELKQKPKIKSKTLAKLEPGVVTQLLKTTKNWCQIKVSYQNAHITGWVKKSNIWGVL